MSCYLLRLLFEVRRKVVDMAALGQFFWNFSRTAGSSCFRVSTGSKIFVSGLGSYLLCPARRKRRTNYQHKLYYSFKMQENFNIKFSKKNKFVKEIEEYLEFYGFFFFEMELSKLIPF
jgi:hypothetical protein